MSSEYIDRRCMYLMYTKSRYNYRGYHSGTKIWMLFLSGKNNVLRMRATSNKNVYIDEAQKAETVLSAVSFIYIYIYIYITNCRQYCFGLLGLISAVLKYIYIFVINQLTFSYPGQKGRRCLAQHKGHSTAASIDPTSPRGCTSKWQQNQPPPCCWWPENE